MTDASASSDAEDIIRGKGILDGAATLAEAAGQALQFVFRLRALDDAGWQLREPVTDDYGLIWKPPVLRPGASPAELAAVQIRDLMPDTMAGSKAWRALAREGVRSVADVLPFTAAELRRDIPRFGPVSLRLLREALAEHGLALIGETP